MKIINLHSQLKILLIVLSIILLLSIPVVTEAQNVIQTTAHSSAFSGNSRGYWFTAPCNFRLTGVRAPADYSTNAQAIHLVKFPAPPPNFPGTTTVFTTLYYGTNLTDTCFVDLDIQVATGDVIGVMAVRNNGAGTSVTSYSTTNSPITSAIGTYAITLQRLGWQGNIISSPAIDFWTEPGSPIGRAEIRYEMLPALIPMPPQGTNFTGNSRGLWFTAPCDFHLTGIRAPNDFNTNPQSIHLVKFSSTPANYPSTTTTFTTLFYGSNINDTGFIDVNIQIYTGDVIGVLAVRDNGSGTGQTSYSTTAAPIASYIGTHTITMQRLGFQGNIISSPATNFWTEAGLQIGRVDLRHEVPTVYKYLPGVLIANSYPFNETPSGNNKRQWIYHPSEFGCTPTGYVKGIYLKSGGGVNSNITGFLVRMGLTPLSTFPSSTFVTGLDTVLYSSGIHLSSIHENWIPIRLNRPFYFNGSSNFVVEVSHQGSSPGFNIMQNTITGRSIYGNSVAPSGTLHDRLAAFGLEIVTDYTDAMLESFNSPGINLCEGLYPVSVTLKNLSPDTLTQAKINLLINGATQPVINWSGNLPPGNNIIVQMGNFPFAALGSPYNLKAWVSQPNNEDDFNPYNDTIVFANIQASPAPVVNLGPDITLKANGSVVLNAGAGFTYLWSTGATTQTIIVDSTGTGIGTKTVWVQVLNPQSCIASDTILVTFADDTGFEDPEETKGIFIRPNPNDGRFELVINGFGNGDYKIQIVGMNGAVVKELLMQVNNSKQLQSFDLNEIPDGLYLMMVRGNSEIAAKKLVISR